MARGGPDRPAGGGHAHRPRLARPTAAPDARPQGAGARCSRSGLAGQRRVRPAAQSVFDADEAERGCKARAAGASSCASRPSPRTSTACTRRAASSPRAAA
jgi:hypothetical protein